MNQPSELPGYSIGALREMADLIQRTGVGTDKIPALGKAQFMSISDASLSMENDEIVFIVHYPGNLVRIYPQRVLVWHEIVNDVLPDARGNTPQTRVPGVAETAGESYTISYSPLTGSVVAFRSMAGKYPSTFGVTGTLLNGNSVLYDRISRSLWSQLMAVCVEGPFRGKRLTRVPVLWARWGGTRERYGGLHSSFNGKAEVLSRSTGFRRSYGKDPYGSYQRGDTYYDNSALPFPVSSLDVRLPAKRRILGLEIDQSFGAVQVDAVKQMRVYNFTLGMVPLVAVYDAQLDAVRIFDRRLPGLPPEEPLSFIIFEDKLMDEQSRSEWDVTGKSSYGRLREKELSPVLAIDSMWFAWASFYRGSQIFPPPKF
ncbi:DUF3179 domain-containing protein [Desulfovibrio sp. OttesenSCG-928-A18]|nr:DUF3179 domain-containing protein [Desulfovibrio sp. OttesenSCG-928-A18]